MSESKLNTGSLVRAVLPLQQWLDSDNAALQEAKAHLLTPNDIVNYLERVDHSNQLRSHLNNLLSIVSGETAVFFEEIQVDHSSLLVKNVSPTIEKVDELKQDGEVVVADTAIDEAVEVPEVKEIHEAKEIVYAMPADYEPIVSPVLVDTPETESEDENVSDVDEEVDANLSVDDSDTKDRPYPGMVLSSDFDLEAAANKDELTESVLSDLSGFDDVSDIDVDIESLINSEFNETSEPETTDDEVAVDLGIPSVEEESESTEEFESFEYEEAMDEDDFDDSITEGGEVVDSSFDVDSSI